MYNDINISVFLGRRKRFSQVIRFFWRTRYVDFLAIWPQDMSQPLASMMQMVMVVLSMAIVDSGRGRPC